VHFDDLAHAIPYHPPRFTPDATSCIVPGEQGDRVIEPQELDERAWIDARILLSTSHCLETRGARHRFDVEDSPPSGDDFQSFGEMPLPYNKGNQIEDSAVQVCLTDQASQTVSVRLDLVPVNAAIDDGKVNAHSAAADAQLFDECRIRIVTVRGSDVCTKGGPNVRISEYTFLKSTRRTLEMNVGPFGGVG
jgi:hypothetical protein